MAKYRGGPDRVVPAPESMPSLAGMYEEVKSKPSGATRSHTLNTDQFGDENLTPGQKEHYDRLGEVKRRGGQPVPSEEPKKPKMGDEQNPLPPGGKAAIKPPVPPTPQQTQRRRVVNMHKLQSLARKSKGRRR